MTSTPRLLTEGARIHGHSARYTVEHPLGEGGFARTYVARRETDAASVVLKVLRLERQLDFKALELFEREAKVLAGLTHPGVPRTHELFVWDGQQAYAPDDVAKLPDGRPLDWVMVQSRAPGRSLADRIAARERMDAAALESLLRRMLEILGYLHGLHPPVIHRDITPGNIILDDEGGAMLVDFGAIRDRLRSASTVASTSVGTFGYIPMEQMMGQARSSSDLYGLAMTLVVVATHRTPEALPLHDDTGAVDLAQLELAWPPPLRAALAAMLEPVVGKRVASVSEVVRILDGGAAVGGETSLVPHSSQTPDIPGRLRYPWLWNTTLGVGGLAAGAIYLVAFDMFSETMLIQLSALWLAPVAFGLVGRWADQSLKRNPIATATLGAGVAVIALLIFIYGIFPGL
ncbi:MAG: serine/threonine protein kinase [Deltaproteobacteria bacterium]|nr:serine/threonine protein kinase [Deltaproteobacteria bacterium]